MNLCLVLFSGFYRENWIYVHKESTREVSVLYNDCFQKALVVPHLTNLLVQLQKGIYCMIILFQDRNSLSKHVDQFIHIIY